jgi:5-methylcytosine-specific restriction endonuclease McrA
MKYKKISKENYYSVNSYNIIKDVRTRNKFIFYEPPCKSIIKLKKSNNRNNKTYTEFTKKSIKRTKIPDFIKNKIYSEQDEKCTICRSNLGEHRVMDHIKPLSLNGLDNINNFQALCGTCNDWKTYRFDKLLKKFLYNKPSISISIIKELQREEYTKFYSPC